MALTKKQIERIEQGFELKKNASEIAKENNTSLPTVYKLRDRWESKNKTSSIESYSNPHRQDNINELDSSSALEKQLLLTQENHELSERLANALIIIGENILMERKESGKWYSS